MASNTLAILAALDKAAAEAATPRGTGRVIFGIDATGSREASWAAAREVQSSMFAEAAKFGTLSLQLIYFGGFETCRASKFTTSPTVLAALMNSIRCASGSTQITKLMSRVIEEQEKEPLSAFIYIGDAMEEDVEPLDALFAQLKCPAFLFQEGDSHWVTEHYKRWSTLTKGAFAYFDSSAPAALGELLSAVAAFATGGIRALQAQGTAAATLLISQLKKD